MCLRPVRLSISNKVLQVPCGRCLECESVKASNWSHRVLTEIKDGKPSCFITLTYDNEHLPADRCVSVSELQKFFKRFRKKYKGIKIKYLACGEYGDKKGRPHYHAIIMGYAFPIDGQVYTNNTTVFLSSELQSLWKFGFSSVEETCYKNIRYVCKYAQKQLFPDKIDKFDRAIYGRQKAFYFKYGLTPPFLLMSKGIGYENWSKNPDFVTGKIYNDGHYMSIPRYFIDRYERETGLSMDELRAKRIEIASLNMKTDEELEKHEKIVLKRLHKFI